MQENDALKHRAEKLMLVFLIIALFFTLRLGWLQVIQGRDLAALAARYHSRTVFYRWGHGNEGRGAILDRYLRPFTEAKLKPGLAVFPAIGCSEEEYDYWMHILEDCTGLSRDEIVQRSSLRRPLPITKATDLQTLPHWIVPVAGEWDSGGSFRRYTYGDLACHVLGFVSSPFSGEDAPGLLVGRMGIEKAYDSFLRCQRPGVSAVVDANDKLIGGLGYRSTITPDNQPNVVLSLDLDIQKAVEKIFDDYIKEHKVPATGAIVVMDPDTGDVLAMVSRPVIKGAEYQHNRATRKSDNVTMLPMASVAKLITAAAALEKNPNLLNARYTCNGIHCLDSHGNQDMAEALANSCNLYFAQLAETVGRKDLLNMATVMGLGSKPDLGLPDSEVGGGSLPSLKDLATAAGLTNHFAMGGNKLEATPVQVAAMLSSIANGGYYVEPRLVLAVNQDPASKLRTPAVKRKKIMGTATAQLMAKMMHGVVEKGNTIIINKADYPFAISNLAAKTGSSDENLPPRDYQILWSCGFFPWRNPQYVVVYMAENPPRPRKFVERGNLLAEITEKLAGLKNR